jgi:hypothetical protein
MKRIILIICLCFLSLGAFSQKKNAWSLEATSGTYLYYLIQQNEYDKYSNRFNYEFSLIGSRYFSMLKLSTGIMYSTKNIMQKTRGGEVDPNYIVYVDYSVQYIKVPIFISFGKTFNSNISLNVKGGLVVDKMLKYNVSIKEDKGFSDKNYDIDRMRIGILARAGLELSIKVIDKGYININPFVDYKLLKDDLYTLPNKDWGVNPLQDYFFRSMPNGEMTFGHSSNDNGGLLSYGLSIGFEYVF